MLYFTSTARTIAWLRRCRKRKPLFSHTQSSLAVTNCSWSSPMGRQVQPLQSRSRDIGRCSAQKCLLSCPQQNLSVPGKGGKNMAEAESIVANSRNEDQNHMKPGSISKDGQMNLYLNILLSFFRVQTHFYFHPSWLILVPALLSNSYFQARDSTDP